MRRRRTGPPLRSFQSGCRGHVGCWVVSWELAAVREAQVGHRRLCSARAVTQDCEGVAGEVEKQGGRVSVAHVSCRDGRRHVVHRIST